MPEDASLTLLTPVPEEKLLMWLKEFYGKPIEIDERELLRHRDLSYVERLVFKDALPPSLIYKQVLPPWDVEQDLHEKILIPSITNSAQLYMSAHSGDVTAMFVEDLGSVLLKDSANPEIAQRLGEELAKMHRSYCYRTDELVNMGVLSALLPNDYVAFTAKLTDKLASWQLVTTQQVEGLRQLADQLAVKLAGEPFSLVHGDLYGENIILRGERLFIIDWSWFTMLGVPLMDLATVTMNHHKNGGLSQFADAIIEAYCFEAGRDSAAVRQLIPAAETLGRLLFLSWLVERRSRRIMGTTVGPVDDLIGTIVNELLERLATMTA